nr:YggS family pyridoxal phosphate-dependent enzyme [Candidatus Krumholzibacteria bacterium]
MNTIKVADNLAAIRDRVAAACLKAGRPEGSVRLVAVSKRISTPLVLQAVAAGQLDLGENRLPEAVDRQ